MQQASGLFLVALAALLGALGVLGASLFLARRQLAQAGEQARDLLAGARLDAENKQKEMLVAAQERTLALQDECDRRERELEERELRAETRAQQLTRDTAEVARLRKQLERRTAEVEKLERQATELESQARVEREAAQHNLERVAGVTADQARAELIAGMESEARAEGTRLARKIEDEARENADREALNLIVQASQRVSLREVVESTVSFIELPNDEMKGRIIGKEGRNIRALEMATGIDLIVDDTPRSIWISSFDPLRREIARVAIDRLLEDGRIHPARIEEVVQRVAQEVESILLQKGEEAAFSLGITDMNPKLLRLVGKTRYYMRHGQNLLQHCLETAMIAGFMAQELGGQLALAQRAGLLHEIGQVAEDSTDHTLLAAADLAAKYDEHEDVVHAIRSLHADIEPSTLEALLLNTANRLSEARPGARKENLAVFIERLRRLETIASRFPGVQRAYAVKAGKDLRVILDVTQTSDSDAYQLSKQIARALERELSYSGQIKVSVVREMRAVRFAL